MKHVRYLLLAFVFFSLFPTMLEAKAPFKDVKKDHWAYEAVMELAHQGIIKGFPDSEKFKGKKSLTRYQMARVVKDVIDTINAENQTALVTMSTDTMKIVEALIKEYSDEIQSMMSRIDNLEKKSDKLDYKVEITNSKVNALAQDRIQKKTIKKRISNVQRENDRRFLAFLLAIAVLAVKVF